MKKFLILFFSIFMIVISFNVKANENQENFKLENEDYVYDEELEEEIKEEYKQYVIIGDESISLDYDLIEQSSVDYDIIHKIEDNISVVNEMASIPSTSLNSDGEIELNIEEEYDTEFELIDFKFSWSGIKICMNNFLSLTAGIFGILYNIADFGIGTVNSLGKFNELCNYDELAAIITNTLLYLPLYGISSTICEFIENSIANIIPVIISFNLAMMTLDTAAIITGTHLINLFIKTVFKCYFALHIPSISDCSIIAYKAANFGLCANINVGWFKTTIKMV